jgi:KipI family sensor histidine kinase inhibitor
MENDFRIMPAGDSAVIVEFEKRIDPLVNARAIRLAASIHAAPLGGVRDVVPTYRSVAVYFDPLRTDFARLRERLEREAAQPAPGSVQALAPVRIPVCYGGAFGPDLREVAEFAGVAESEVIALHAGALYRVFMLGFLPGFAYMGSVDARIALPRRSKPRVRVPRGSVGIAGVQTGIYPADTPGGWQLIGRTPLMPFDLSRPEPFLLKAGDAVQFYPIERYEYDGERAASPDAVPVGGSTDAPSVRRSGPPGPGGSTPSIHIVRPGMLTTIQDRGRWGLQARGVPVAGPMDPCSHRLANALVGNDRDAATLEVTLLGPEVEFEDERAVAVAGAEFALSVDGRSMPINAAFVVSAGSCLRFGARSRGARAYVAIEGGIMVAPTLGSRATHLTSRTGGCDGRALAAGDRLPLGDRRRAHEKVTANSRVAVVPMPAGHARVRVLPGPQCEYFADDALETLQSARYGIGNASDRMGFRLEGTVLRHVGSADIISDATPLGVLQVPASGQPILLMADRQTTGGYPILAIVITADISVAGQLGPGDAISFEVCTEREALAALIAQERALMAVEALSGSGDHE